MRCLCLVIWERHAPHDQVKRLTTSVSVPDQSYVAILLWYLLVNTRLIYSSFNIQPKQKCRACAHLVRGFTTIFLTENTDALLCLAFSLRRAPSLAGSTCLCLHEVSAQCKISFAILLKSAKIAYDGPICSLPSQRCSSGGRILLLFLYPFSYASHSILADFDSVCRISISFFLNSLSAILLSGPRTQ